MIDLQKASKFQNFDILSKVKQRQIHCPISNLRAMTSTLLTIEDLVLKTTLSSIDIYDEQLTNILFDHTIFIDRQPMTIDEYIDNISILDRRVITWGVFASSFNTLGKLQIQCPECGFTFENEVFAEELIQEDSFVLWDKPQPFNEFVYPITIVPNLEGVYKIELLTSIPSIRQYISTIRLIPPEKIKENFKKSGTIMSKPEELTSVTRCIRLWESESSPAPIEWLDTEEIHFVIGRKFPIALTKYALEQYDTEFGKYLPVFKKKFTCPNKQCGKDFFFIADPEVSLFRQFLE